MAQKPSTMSITCMPAGQGFLVETQLGVGKGGISKDEDDDAADEGKGDI